MKLKLNEISKLDSFRFLIVLYVPNANIIVSLL